MFEARDPDIFWGEIAPCDHLVQIYDESYMLIDALDRFVGDGLRNNESVIVIATPQHLTHLDACLIAQGIDVRIARLSDRYLTWDARQVLSLFMVDGWPDEQLFTSTILSLLVRARTGNRKVRAFGEMVALLWAEGNQAATVRLEHLWHRLCSEHQFPLFCAYPKAGFTQDIETSIAEICATHSRVVGV